MLLRCFAMMVIGFIISMLYVIRIVRVPLWSGLGAALIAASIGAWFDTPYDFIVIILLWGVIELIFLSMACLTKQAAETH